MQIGGSYFKVVGSRMKNAWFRFWLLLYR